MRIEKNSKNLGLSKVDEKTSGKLGIESPKVKDLPKESGKAVELEAVLRSVDQFLGNGPRVLKEVSQAVKDYKTLYVNFSGGGGQEIAKVIGAILGGLKNDDK